MQTLQGGCACGRNNYTVTFPEKASEQAQIILDNSAHSRRLQASPLIAFLKIPVPWFQSSTVAFFPDETHQTIRRTFSSPARDNLRNQFCGYCGTQLTQLNDSSRENDGFIWLTLGSLLDDEMDKLEKLGILDLDDVEDQSEVGSGAAAEPQNEAARNALFKPAQGVGHRGAPWFEDSVESTKLGRLKRQRGGETSADGSTSIEWKIMEFTSDGSSPSKRKFDDAEDVEGIQ